MTPGDFRPRPDEPFDAWFARTCPDDSALLSGFGTASREAAIHSAAFREGRGSLLHDLVGDLARNAEVDAHALVQMVVAREAALCTRRRDVRDVNEFLTSLDGGGDND